MIDPLLSLRLSRQPAVYAPGEVLWCDYQIDAVEQSEISAVEASVLWYTEGKGEEDMGVHYFERRTPSDTPDGDLCPMRRFETELPRSPLSYAGVILKIRWCVRLRVFLRKGREFRSEQVFTLTTTASKPREARQPALAGAGV